MSMIRRRHGSSDSVHVMHVLWCSPRVISQRKHASIVKAAVDQPLEEVETQGRGHPGMRR